MDTISAEIKIVQNPALGAGLIWRFVCGYYNEDQKEVPFPLIFIIIPTIMRNEICSEIISTNRPSGLSKVSEKVFKHKKNDLLFDIHKGADIMRSLTLESLWICLVSSLVSIDIESATVLPCIKTNRQNLNKSIIKLMTAAEKLGIWCSRLTLHEISRLLKVRF